VLCTHDGIGFLKPQLKEGEFGMILHSEPNTEKLF